MANLVEGIRQHDTHRELVDQARPQDATTPEPQLDAIIVPASRSATHLDHAITLARAAHCWLLILCSYGTDVAEVHGCLGERCFEDAIVIDLPQDYRHELLDFPALTALAADFPEACTSYATDLSTKRNIGLILARMLGWQNVFFLDDDIRDINHADLQRTVSLLAEFPAAGMRINEFPDNSVVCHANRLTGADQDVFVSGAALAVDSAADIGFFPDIYNEDWLFFFDYAAAGRLASSGHEVTQLRYYPFAEAERAAWQEFGDVLAEGLYALLHLGLGIQDATGDYWAHFLAARWNFLEGIMARAHQRDFPSKEHMLLSVKSALTCSTTITPELCERYVGAWRQDLGVWKQRMATLGQKLSLDEALGILGLPASAQPDPAKRGARPRDRMAESVPPGPAMIPRPGTLTELAVRVSRYGFTAMSAGGEGEARPVAALTPDYYQG